MCLLPVTYSLSSKLMKSQCVTCQKAMKTTIMRSRGIMRRRLFVDMEWVLLLPLLLSCMGLFGRSSLA